MEEISIILISVSLVEVQKEHIFFKTYQKLRP